MKNIDLNLLPALKVLLTQKNVSRAADMMQLSQPAMSRIFSRLKQEFDDPLMVRAGNQYQLTPRAQILLSQLTQLLPEIESLWLNDEVTLEEAEQTIVLAGTDMDVVYVSDRINQIQLAAPKLNFAIRSTTPRSLDSLISGEIDLVLTAFNDSRAGLYRQLLTQEEFVVVAGKDCVLSADSLDLETYLKQRHGKFSFEEPTRGRVDAALEQLGKQRLISLSLPTFLQIPQFLADSSLLFSVPRSFANYLATHFAIKILPLPFATRHLEIYLYWHERQHQHRLNRWIRQRLLKQPA
ncbi:LysR family transcriptional regulator [Aliikangiella sp. IMCC44653]